MKFFYLTPSLFMLGSLSHHTLAQNVSAEDVQADVLFHPITLQADKFNSVGEKTYQQADLEQIENSNKNITDFLRLHPNVQFDHSQYSALQQGELNPTDISINGAMPYDNKFLLNGMSINNQLNPSNSNGAHSFNELMGNSQAVTLNTDLICELTVLDSNISAAYGEFLGGVVETKTCKPSTKVGTLHGHISYDYTSDHWSSYHYSSPEQRYTFNESSSADIQPHFTKQGLSTALYGNLTEEFGFNLVAAQRWSKIPLKNVLNGARLPTQTRQNQNLSLEGFYDFSAHTQLRAGIHFLENEGLYHQATIKDSSSKHESDSKAVFVVLNQNFQDFSLEHQLNYQYMHSERQGVQDTFSWLSSETKNWNPTSPVAVEGSFGHFEQAEEKFEYALKARMQPVDWGHVTHHLHAGFGYGHYDAFWQRDQESRWYVSNSNLRGQSCLNIYGEYDIACDTATTSFNKFAGQFARTRTVYEAGLIDIEQNRLHAYLEDRIKLNEKISTTWGLRVDYDSLTKSSHFAPRSQLTARPFSEHDFKITTGWNRYYGLNAFQNELQDRKRMLQVTESRLDINSAWDESSGSRYSYMPIRADLDSPFTDEIVLAFSGEHYGWTWQTQWVNRHAQKQLRIGEEYNIDRPDGEGQYSVYAYNNSGYSKANVYTISIENAEPWSFGNIHHRVHLAADYTKVQRSFMSYNDPYADPDKLIYFNDRLIKQVDRPADNFNTPFTLRANWHMQWDHIPLSVNHTLHYRAPSERIMWFYQPYEDQQGELYDWYAIKTAPSAFYWDLKATYSIPMSQKLTAVTSLSINNVTNKKNTYIDESGSRLPEIGRQFIAEIQLKF